MYEKHVQNSSLHTLYRSLQISDPFDEFVQTRLVYLDNIVADHGHPSPVPERQHSCKCIHDMFGSTILRLDLSVLLTPSPLPLMSHMPRFHVWYCQQLI